MFYGKWVLESIQHRINPGCLSGAEALKQGEWTSLVLNRISPGGEGYSWEFLLGVCRSTLFQTNLKCHFPHPFSDLEEITKRNMFTKTEIISSLLRLERRQKGFLKFILNSHTSCGVISYSFGTIRQIRHRSSLENYTRFQTKTAQKPYPLGRRSILVIEGSTPPPPARDYRNKKKRWYFGKGSKSLAANPSRNQVSPGKLQC